MTGLLGLAGPWPMIGAATALSLAVAGSTYWVTSRSYQAKIANMKLEKNNQDLADAKATLGQFVLDAKQIAVAAAQFSQDQKAYNDQLVSISAAWDAARRSNPGNNCPLDPGRVRAIEAAIASANRAISGTGQRPGRAVPGVVRPQPGG